MALNWGTVFLTILIVALREERRQVEKWVQTFNLNIPVDLVTVGNVESLKVEKGRVKERSSTRQTAIGVERLGRAERGLSGVYVS